jgi:hypothetical protein
MWFKYKTLGGGSASRTVNVSGKYTPVLMTTTTLPGATHAVAYSTTLAASGGVAPYTWSLTSGTLPSPCTLSAAGVISGTPTAAGSSTFTIKVTDKTGTAYTRQFTLTVA